MQVSDGSKSGELWTRGRFVVCTSPSQSDPPSNCFHQLEHGNLSLYAHSRYQECHPPSMSVDDGVFRIHIGCDGTVLGVSTLCSSPTFMAPRLTPVPSHHPTYLATDSNDLNAQQRRGSIVVQPSMLGNHSARGR